VRRRVAYNAAVSRPARAKEYHRIKLVIGLTGTVLFVLYAGAWAAWGGPSLVEWTTNRWLGLLAFAAVFGGGFAALTLPLGYYSEFLLEHRYELSRQTLGRFIVQTLKGWAVGALLGGLVLAATYGLLWHGGRWWWLWVWAGWVGLTVVLARLFPVLLLPVFHKSAPLEDEALTRRLLAVAEGTSLRLSGIYNLDQSTDTRAANAMLTGLGGTRRVYLSDTLLQAFRPEEIEVIFAHELGHHTRQHIWKMLVLSAALASLMIAVLAVILDPWKGPHAPWPEAVCRLPAVALAVTLLQLILAPVHNAVSRRFERQCDADALRRTGNPEAYRSAFERLAELNLADPSPHPLIEWYFHDHPALAKRIAMADGV
jgi:STE24 endopeptidase